MQLKLDAFLRPPSPPHHDELERATPLRRALQRALGIIPTANKIGNSMLLYFLLFPTPPLYTVQYVP